MQSHTAITVNTLHAVQGFMDTNAKALGTINTSASRRDLDAIEAELSEHAAVQAGSKTAGKAAVTRKRVARNTLLVKYLRPIAAIAATNLTQSPDYGSLKLPNDVRNTPQLLAAAASMGDAAAKYADVFIAAGMAPTFLADLAAAVNDVKAADAARAGVVTSRMGATKALDSMTQRARKIVKQLDTLIEPQLANDTALLVKWKATKRFTGRTSPVSTAAIDSAQQEVGSAGTPAATPGTSNPVSTNGGASPSSASTSHASTPNQDEAKATGGAGGAVGV